MRSMRLLLLGVWLGGCAHPALLSPYKVVLEKQADGQFERVVPEWTRGQVVAVGVAVGCSLADIGTTIYAREAQGAREMNPLMENYGVLVGSKVLLLVGAWWLGEYTGNRTLIWMAGAVPGCVAAGWNGGQMR